ncbi:MAG: hypothetical protein ABFE08_21945, partial [Armatimonadia bacterium]
AGPDTWSYGGDWLGLFTPDNPVNGGVFGEPMMLKLHTRVDGMRAGQAVLGVWGLKTPWGTAVTWLRNGTQSELTMTLTDEKGAVAQQVSLSAVENQYQRYEARVAALTGRYMAAVRTDTGPLAGEIAEAIPMEMKGAPAAAPLAGPKKLVMKVCRIVLRPELGTDAYSVMSDYHDVRECSVSEYVVPANNMLLVQAIGDTKLTEDEFQALAQELSAVQAPVGLSLFSPQPNLTPDVVARLAKVPNLVTLQLDCRADFDDKACESLAQAKGLRFLWLNGNKKITDRGVECLATLPELGYLGISGASVVGPGLKALRACTKLSRIYLGSPTLKDAAPLGSLEMLRMIDLSGARDLTGLEELGNLKRLERLSILNVDFAPETIRFLAALPSLSDLSIWGNQALTDASMDSLAGARIRSLSLNECKGITDKGLLTLAQSGKVEAVSVRGTAVTDEGIAAAKAARPQLQIIK